MDRKIRNHGLRTNPLEQEGNMLEHRQLNTQTTPQKPKSEYDLEIPHSHTAAVRESHITPKVTRYQEDNQSKATSPRM